MEMYYGCSLRTRQDIKGTNSLCALKDFNRTQKRPQQHPQYSKEAFWLNPFFLHKKPEKLLAAQLQSLELSFSQSKCRLTLCRMLILSTRIYFSCLYKLLLFGLLTVTHCLFTLFSNLDFYTFLTIFWTFYTFLKLLHVTSCNDFS